MSARATPTRASTESGSIISARRPSASASSYSSSSRASQARSISSSLESATPAFYAAGGCFQGHGVPLGHNPPMIAALGGPEAIIEIADPPARLTASLVIASTRLGPAFGGIRVRAYREERDALLDAMDLAATMTLKAALAGLDCGGGKIVVIDRPGLKRGAAI